MATPLQYKLSDAVTMHIDRDPSNFPVIEIEFKFVRYRLVIDDEQKASELQQLILEILSNKPKPKTEEVRLPQFYSKGGK